MSRISKLIELQARQHKIVKDNNIPVDSEGVESRKGLKALLTKFVQYIEKTENDPESA